MVTSRPPWLQKLEQATGGTLAQPVFLDTPVVNRTSIWGVGIDFGTTSSCVAGWRKVIENSEGGRTTPSLVAFTDDGELLVGEPAKRQAAVNPAKTFFDIKRLIGRRYDDLMVEQFRELVPYKIVRAPNGEAWIEALGKHYSPSQISAYVLKNMKETAEAHLGRKVSLAVVTVPAHFNAAQRRAVRDAGKIAGLEELRIINEPAAAVLAYDLDRGKSGTIAVFDLRESTFDISIMEVKDGAIAVRCTRGDIFLGGDDFNTRLVNYLADEFQKAHGFDVRDDRLALYRLKEVAEKANAALFSTKQIEVIMPFVTATKARSSKHLSTWLTRSNVEVLFGDLIHRTIELSRGVLRDAGLAAGAIDHVILVGSMALMPKVQDLVHQLFGGELLKSINSNEVVAIGASEAGVDCGADDLVLTDVTPLSLGIETLGGVFTPIIERGTQIPTEQTQVFSTGDDYQTSLTIRIFQGVRKMVSNNRLLAHLDVIGIPPAPRGVPQIEITFAIDANGLISFSANDRMTGKMFEIHVQASGGLSEADIERMVRDAKLANELQD